MRQQTAVRLAWALSCASTGLLVASAVLEAPTIAELYADDGTALIGLAFVAVGGFLAARRPGNPIGWLFAGWGAVMAYMTFAGSYVGHAMAHPGSLPGHEWVAFVAAVLWHPAYVLLVFVLLGFPHGRLLSRRWRPVAWLTVAAYGTCAVTAALAPAVAQTYFPAVRPAYDWPGAALAEAVFWAVLLVAQVGLLGAAGIAALVQRLRRARGEERQQVKWFVYTIAAAVAAFLAGVLVLGAGYLFPVFAAVPVAAALAILRRRLYDIDRVINRTLVYGVVSALLGLGYIVVVVVLGQLVGERSSLAVAGATLAMAALFQPARRRIQAAVDRRFNRRRYDAARTIEAFSARLREELDLDTLSAELLAVVDQTMEPVTASLWLRPSVGSQQPPR